MTTEWLVKQPQITSVIVRRKQLLKFHNNPSKCDCVESTFDLCHPYKGGGIFFCSNRNLYIEKYSHQLKYFLVTKPCVSSLLSITLSRRLNENLQIHPLLCSFWWRRRIEKKYIVSGIKWSKNVVVTKRHSINSNNIFHAMSFVVV